MANYTKINYDNINMPWMSSLKQRMLDAEAIQLYMDWNWSTSPGNTHPLTFSKDIIGRVLRRHQDNRPVLDLHNA
jgi:hypothetical protein